MRCWRSESDERLTLMSAAAGERGEWVGATWRGDATWCGTSAAAVIACMLDSGSAAQPLRVATPTPTLHCDNFIHDYWHWTRLIISFSPSMLGHGEVVTGRA
jgi:hypothetical protein